MYHDGVLPQDQASVIAEHLEQCPDCRTRQQAYAEDMAVMDQLREAAHNDETRCVPHRPSNHRPQQPLDDIADKIGGYKLIREVSRGGQGIVFEAIQLSTKRRVALKVLQEGPFIDERRRRRFEAEVELASHLDHPNVVAIYDSGLVEGHFYYAMEYVDGPRLDEYLAARQLTIRQRVELFRIICEAVSYAHQHGIIHRDLKPSNIRLDANGQPHLLDFGLAKRADSSFISSCEAAITLSSEFIGTLAYAAPEQTTGQPRLVDTRTDVYSLGVILYEIITGDFPYPVSGHMADVMKHILETDPKRPSTLTRKLDHDLETIVLKSLSKTQDKRYQTAGHLLDDINRYLEGEPIEAKRTKSLYVVNKIIRKHRAPIAVTMAICVMLLSFLGWHGWTMAKVQQREKVAQESARRINTFLQDILDSVKPAEIENQDTTVLQDILSNAAKLIEREYSDEPLIESSLRITVGKTYLHLGMYAQAEEHLREALRLRLLVLQPNHADVADAKNHLASLLKLTSQLDEAEQLQREALDIVSSGPHASELKVPIYTNDLATILYTHGNYEEAAKLYGEALSRARQIYGEQHYEVATILNNLAVLQQTLGQYDEAEASYRQTIKIYEKWLEPGDPLIATTLFNLAQVLAKKGNVEESASLHNKVLEMRQKLFGGKHLSIAQSMDALGEMAMQRGDYSESKRLLDDSLEIKRVVVGDDHPEIARTMSYQGMLAYVQGDFDTAEPLLMKALQIRQKACGGEHLSTIESQSNVANLYLLKGLYSEAEELFSQVLTCQTQLLGYENLEVATTMNNLAEALRKQEKLAAAKSYYEKSLEIKRKLVGDQHTSVANSLNNLGLIYKAQGEYEQAEQCYLDALRIYQSSSGVDNPNAGYMLYNLGMINGRLNRLDKAGEYLAASIEVFEKCFGPEHERTMQTRHQLAALENMSDRRANQ